MAVSATPAATYPLPCTDGIFDFRESEVWNEKKNLNKFYTQIPLLATETDSIVERASAKEWFQALYSSESIPKVEKGTDVNKMTRLQVLQFMLRGFPKLQWNCELCTIMAHAIMISRPNSKIGKQLAEMTGLQPQQASLSSRQEPSISPDTRSPSPRTTPIVAVAAAAALPSQNDATPSTQVVNSSSVPSEPVIARPLSAEKALPASSAIDESVEINGGQDLPSSTQREDHPDSHKQQIRPKNLTHDLAALPVRPVRQHAANTQKTLQQQDDEGILKVRQQELQKSEIAIREAEETLQTQRKERNDLIAESQGLKENISRLKDEQSVMDENLGALSREIEELEDKRNGLQSEAENRMAKQEQMEVLLQELQAIIDHQKQTIETQETTIAWQMSSTEATKVEADSLRSQMAIKDEEFEKRLKELEDENLKRSDRINDLEEIQRKNDVDIGKMKQDLSVAESTLNSARVDLCMQTQKIVQLEKDAQDFNEATGHELEMNLQMQERRELSARMDAELEETKKELSQKQAELKDVISQCMHLRDNNAARSLCEEKESKLAELLELLANAESDLHSTTDDVQAAKKECEDLNKAKAELEASIETLKASEEELKKQAEFYVDANIQSVKKFQEKISEYVNSVHEKLSILTQNQLSQEGKGVKPSLANSKKRSLLQSSEDEPEGMDSHDDRPAKVSRSSETDTCAPRSN